MQGSTRGGLVGETSIDFADYADATKTCNVCLPLQNSNSKALLHVSFLLLLLSFFRLFSLMFCHEETLKAHKISAFLSFFLVEFCNVRVLINDLVILTSELFFFF